MKRFLSFEEQYKVVPTYLVKNKPLYQVVSGQLGISKTEAKRLIKSGAVSIGRTELTHLKVGKLRNLLII